MLWFYEAVGTSGTDGRKRAFLRKARTASARSRRMAGGLYDSLTSVPLTWEGSFRKSLDRVLASDAHVTADDLRKFMKDPQVIQYIAEPPSEIGKLDRQVWDEDLDRFATILTYREKHCLEDESLIHDIGPLLSAHTMLANAMRKSHKQCPAFGTILRSREDDIEWMRPIVRLGYETLLEHSIRGLPLDPSLVYALVSGSDRFIRVNGQSEEARQKLVEHVIDTYPISRLYPKEAFSDPEEARRAASPNPVGNMLSHGILASDLHDLLGLTEGFPLNLEETAEAFEHWTIGAQFKGDSQTRRIESTTISVLSAPVTYDFRNSFNALRPRNLMETILVFGYASPEDTQPASRQDKIAAQEQDWDTQEFADGGKAAKELDFATRAAQKPMGARETVSVGAIEKALSTFSGDYRRIGRDEVARLREMPVIQHMVKTGVMHENRSLMLGLASTDDTVKAIQAKPEILENMRYTDHVPNDVIQKAFEVVRQKRSEARKDGMAVWKSLVDKGEIQVSRLDYGSYGLSDMFEKEASLLGLPQEKLDWAIENIPIYFVNKYALSSELFLANTDRVGTLKMDGWRGVFIGSFPNPSDPPAIIVDRSDGMGGGKQALLDKLNLPWYTQSGATLSHEVAHLLQWLGTSDAMFQGGDKSTHRADRAEYVSAAPELFARAHGDIPYWREKFTTGLKSVMDQPMIQKAVIEELFSYAQKLPFVLSPAEVITGMRNMRTRIMAAGGEEVDVIDAQQEFLDKQKQTFFKGLPSLRSAAKELLLKACQETMWKLNEEHEAMEERWLRSDPTLDYSAYYGLGDELDRIKESWLAIKKNADEAEVDTYVDSLLYGLYRDYFMDITGQGLAGGGDDSETLGVGDSSMTDEDLEKRQESIAKEKTPLNPREVSDVTRHLIELSRPMPNTNWQAPTPENYQNYAPQGQISPWAGRHIDTLVPPASKSNMKSPFNATNDGPNAHHKGDPRPEWMDDPSYDPQKTVQKATG